MKLLLILLFYFSFIQSHSLYIFYPNIQNSDSLKIKLEKQLLNTKVKIFGKYSLLKKELKKNSSCYIISTPIVFKELDTLFTTKLKGVKNNSITENYTLISLSDNKFKIDSIKKSKIGFVNQGSRKYNEKLVKKILSIKTNNVKRVTKLEDLISLLRFNIIDYALIQKDELSRIKKLTNLNIYSKNIENPHIEIISFGQYNYEQNYSEEQKNELTKQILELPQSTNQFLRIDSWTE